MKLADPNLPPATEESVIVSAGVAAHDGEIAPPGHSFKIPLHVNARGMALGVLATIAFVWALQWSEKFLVPLLLGVFIAYTLSPVVQWLERLHIKRVIGATLVTVFILAVLAGVLYRVQGEILNVVDELPTITHKLTKVLTDNSGGQPSTIQQMQAAASEIERATANVGSDASRAAARRAMPAAAAGGGFKVMDWVLAGSIGMITFISQATMVVFLVFFLLLAGDTFKRKLVKLTGPSLTRKKVTVHILDDINTSIQAYMFMLLVTNVLLALLMWLALSAIGLENAGAWAILAGLLHIMPYFGPLLITAATGIVAFMQFEQLKMVLLVAGASLAIATLVGTVVATWMTGRIARMNPAAVFVSLLFWGWLWGVWGLLLGVPVVVILKVIAERVEGMEVVAELLGE
ncbi:AI-2E family transporter [Massilia eurypsychrophila]|jgi:predicted PurR-regulated permease PerM|uniref:AI-2E family transporter n=2 Tax=Massilia eurypsychrophila TaxID=1485217 RepID=A0A2G8TD16_9BURK|nr:AI-2E family transporter [Massilia eurypsychrophila]PIL43951.1 AI-2E family transporter [Massilia eurypsychrophila]